jgi:hypothetical protein
LAIVADMDEIADDQQILASEALMAFADGNSLTVNSPIWIRGQQKTKPRLAPAVGERSEEVLRAVGYSNMRSVRCVPRVLLLDARHGNVKRQDHSGDGSLRLITPLFAVVIRLIEIEHVKEVTDCRRIGRHIGIVLVRAWVRQIIAAADGERIEVPVALDEFEDRDMVVVAMHHMPASRIGLAGT